MQLNRGDCFKPRRMGETIHVAKPIQMGDKALMMMRLRIKIQWKKGKVYQKATLMKKKKKKVLQISRTEMIRDS